jgi:hypothetical protein
VPRDERSERVSSGAGLRSARILRYAGEDSVGARGHGLDAAKKCGRAIKSANAVGSMFVT